VLDAADKDGAEVLSEDDEEGDYDEEDGDEEFIENDQLSENTRKKYE
jgi:hypothetical protein